MASMVGCKWKDTPELMKKHTKLYGRGKWNNWSKQSICHKKAWSQSACIVKDQINDCKEVRKGLKKVKTCSGRLRKVPQDKMGLVMHIAKIIEKKRCSKEQEG